MGGGAAALAAEPPNQNDPCSRNGRNTCGTNGEGSYRELPLRHPLVRGLPPRRGGGQRRHVLHRPAVLVPVEVVRLRGALGRGAANKESEAVSATEAAADEPRAVALRALEQRRPAGRGDGLRAPPDGRRGARRGRSERALGARAGRSTRRSRATRSASPGPTRSGDAAGEADRRPAAELRSRSSGDRPAGAGRRRGLSVDRRRGAGDGSTPAPTAGRDGRGDARAARSSTLDARTASLPAELPDALRAHAGPVGAQRAADRGAARPRAASARGARRPCGPSRRSRRRSARRPRRPARRSPTR